MNSNSSQTRDQVYPKNSSPARALSPCRLVRHVHVQSVSQSVISRSRPALTPPPARSPAPPHTFICHPGKTHNPRSRGEGTVTLSVISQLFHGPAPRSPLYTGSQSGSGLRHSRSNTSTEYSLPVTTVLYIYSELGTRSVEEVGGVGLQSRIDDGLACSASGKRKLCEDNRGEGARKGFSQPHPAVLLCQRSSSSITPTSTGMPRMTIMIRMTLATQQSNSRLRLL